MEQRPKEGERASTASGEELEDRGSGARGGSEAQPWRPGAVAPLATGWLLLLY